MGHSPLKVTAFLILVVCCSAAASQRAAVFAQQEVAFESQGTRLAGVLWVPAGEARVPAVVIIHGSGSADRDQVWASAVARGLASRGVAVLLPDKRGAGESGGDWKTASFDVLAEDAIAGVRLLKEQPRIDPARIGIVGLSQGGHIAPLAAVKSADIAFVISLSASVVPITEQATDEVLKAAERKGLSGVALQELRAIHDLLVHYALTGQGWEEYAAAVKRSQGTPWGEMAATLPQDPHHWVLGWARLVGDYDPMPHWKQMRRPALIIYGAEDERIRVQKSVTRLSEMLASHSLPITTLVFGGSGHALWDPQSLAARHGGEPHEMRIRNDLMDWVAQWVDSFSKTKPAVSRVR